MTEENPLQDLRHVGDLVSTPGMAAALIPSCRNEPLANHTGTSFQQAAQRFVGGREIDITHRRRLVEHLGVAKASDMPASSLRTPRLTIHASVHAPSETALKVFAIWEFIFASHTQSAGGTRYTVFPRWVSGVISRRGNWSAACQPSIGDRHDDVYHGHHQQ